MWHQGQEGTLAETTTGARAADDPLAATIAQIERSWVGLLSALEGVPEERLTEPNAVGEWSIATLMGHVAYWDQQAVVAGERELRGEPKVEVDWQAANDQEAKTNDGRGASEQRASMDRAHAAMIELLRTTPPTDPRVLGLCGCLQGDTFEHYDEHAADIRVWRERVRC